MRNRFLIILFVAMLSANANPTSAQKSRKDRGPVNRPSSLSISTKSMVRGILENMTRAIEVYSTTRSLRGARKYIRSVEKDLDMLRKRMSESEPLIENLQNARYSLIRAESFFKAKVERNKVSKEELDVLTEMSWTYHCSSENSEGFTEGFLVDSCIKTIMDEVKEYQRQAFLVAANAGFYSP